MRELSQPVYNNGDINLRYSRAAQDLINIIFEMNREISELKNSQIKTPYQAQPKDRIDC
jgi:hypothetical protein